MRGGHSRREVCGAGLALLGTAALGAEPPRDTRHASDFDELWRTLGDRYCYFGEKRTDWDRVRALYRPQAVAAGSDAAFAEMVRRVLGELYDAHTHLADPPDGAPRWPPYDLFVERGGGGARVVAVQGGSVAESAGIAIGDVVVAVEGRPVDAAAREHAPRCLSRPDPAADAHAINTAVAGRRGRGRQLTVRSKGVERRVELPLTPRVRAPDLESRTLPGGLGYIAIRSFGDAATVAKFDAALAGLRDAPALLIDVRDNGGGDTAVARPIMGRFIAERRAYATMRRREGRGLSAAWTEHVDPRGPFTFERPVAVLCNRWSGSMAEGFPMGMRGIGRATVVGTPMMTLGAAVFPLTLDRTGLRAQYSAEPVYDVRGRARALFRPDVIVPDGQDVLAAGMATVQRLIAAAI